MAESLSDHQEVALGGQEYPADPSLALQPNSTPLICGVNGALVESFLLLIRDNYKKADKATFFLEQRSGIVNIQGITNIRDVLSHLVTLLNPDTPEDKRLEQLGNAEEHLRRAINEPYEVALNELTVRFAALYENYKKRVLPIKEQHQSFHGAPNSVSVEASLREIRDLSSTGRASKGKNLWNPEWELGVASFIQAFEKLFNLHSELEGYYFKVEQIERDNERQRELVRLRDQLSKESTQSSLFHLGGYTLAIILFILGVVITIIIAIFTPWLEALKSLLHIS